MPRGPVSEERMVAQLAALDEKRKALKKKLQVFRIRAAAKKRKSVMSSIRKNEKAVLDVLKESAPDFFQKLMDGGSRKPRQPRKTKGKKS